VSDSRSSDPGPYPSPQSRGAPSVTFDDETLRAAFGTLDLAQASARGDMDPETFRRAAHAVADLMADYLAGVERFPVLPAVEPGELRARFPAAAPERPVPLGDVLVDYRALVEPNITHWQHPAFFAYFASSGSAPGILGEMLMATLVGNAMLWRTSPVATELEEVTVDWLRQGFGLPDGFDGFFTDTASTSSLIGLAGARQALPGNDAAADGLAGHPALRVYASVEAHSSIEKAAMTLGIGRAGTRRIPVDDAYRMDVAALEAAIREDRAAGHVPCAVVATIGTTGPTSVDPTAAIADVAQREGLWLHVDAAYAGATALLAERREPFAGWERADSIVVNPHKWLFTPLDASLFLTRRPQTVRAAFSLVPEYLRTLDRAGAVHDFNEYTPQLGRRFRALKMWMLLRYFGLEGIRARLREHIALAQQFAGWVDAEPDAERLAPVPFSTVCFRWRPRRFMGREDEPGVRAQLDRLNAALLEAINREGRVFLSHTRLRERLALRLAIGGVRTEGRHVALAWERIREHARALDTAPAGSTALAP
jgi:aromatic-L-amino-acid decarboxylase